MKDRFEKATDVQALTARLGCYDEDYLPPSFDLLAKAKVWTEPAYAPLRKLLAEPRPQPTLTVSAEADVRGVIIPDAGDGREGCDVKVYKYGPAVPGAVVTEPVRLLVLHLVGEFRADGAYPHTALGTVFRFRGLQSSTEEVVFVRDRDETGVQRKKVGKLESQRTVLLPLSEHSPVFRLQRRVGYRRGMKCGRTQQSEGGRQRLAAGGPASMEARRNGPRGVVR